LTIPPSRLRRATSLYTREALQVGRNLKRLPPGGKLSAKLTDEGDIRPLPFKASNTVGRALAAAEKSIVPNGRCPLIRHGLGRDTFPPGGRLQAGRNLKRLPPGGKLAANLTDEGDIRPLPFKASNTVGRAFKERPYGFYRNVFTLSVGFDATSRISLHLPPAARNPLTQRESCHKVPPLCPVCALAERGFPW